MIIVPLITYYLLSQTRAEFLDDLKQIKDFYTDAANKAKAMEDDPTYKDTEYAKSVRWVTQLKPAFDRQMNAQMKELQFQEMQRPVAALSKSVNGILQAYAKEHPTEAQQNHLTQEIGTLEVLYNLYVTQCGDKCTVISAETKEDFIGDKTLFLFSKSIDPSQIKALQLNSTTERTYYYRGKNDAGEEVIIKLVVPLSGESTLTYYLNPGKIVVPKNTQAVTVAAAATATSSIPQRPEGTVGPWYGFFLPLDPNDPETNRYLKGALSVGFEGQPLPTSITFLSLEYKDPSLSSSTKLSTNGALTDLYVLDNANRKVVGLKVGFESFSVISAGIDIPTVGEVKVTTKDFKVFDYAVDLPINIPLIGTSALHGDSLFKGTFGNGSVDINTDYTISDPKDNRTSTRIQTGSTISEAGAEFSKISIENTLHLDPNSSISFLISYDKAQTNPQQLWITYRFSQ